MLFSQLSILAAAWATTSLPQAWTAPTPSFNGAIYTLFNSPNGSAIIAMDIDERGRVSNAVRTPTGGRGLSGVTGPGQPAVGSLFGSDAVTVGDNYLFNINAGSNTVSMYNIRPFDPLNPVLVGRPADTLGDFPMSLTYSSALSTVCVLNGGRRGGVTCFSVDASTGLTALDSAPRSISQALNQTTPPVGPFSTASDIKFNPSSSVLIATVKGTPQTTPPTPGFIFAWPVVGGTVSTTGTARSLPTVILDFSITFTEDDFSFFLTDPALGADVIGITGPSLTASSNLQAVVDQPINITYQKATCWSTYDPTTSSVFIADAASANITVLGSVDGRIQQTINFDPAVTGGLDLGVAGTTLFVLAENGEIVSIDISGVGAGKPGRQIQIFDPMPTGNKSDSLLNGMGVYLNTGSM